MRSNALARGVGLGFRPEIGSDLLFSPDAVDFVEVVAETCFSQASTRREAIALAERWPVVPHGVKLSLGSADGIDDARLGRLAQLARDLHAPVVSEHVSFTRGGDTEIGHLTALPCTREAVNVVARNVARARSRLPDVPFLLENVAASFDWPPDEQTMDEGVFYTEVAEATGCPMLLDVGNLYANARNAGRDPRAVLETFPLDRVAMLHIAGGVFEDGFYFDTHAHPVPDEVFDLVGLVLERCPDVPVLLERDGNFGPFSLLTTELSRVRALRPGRRGPLPLPVHVNVPVHVHDPRASTLLAQQRAVAHLLVDIDEPRGDLAERIGLPALARSRDVLTRKRVDDALPLLGRLSRRIDELRPLADHVTKTTPRAPSGAGPADARRIADAAASDPRLRDDALYDRLMLRARFAAPDATGRVSPRTAPFLGTETLSDGTRLRAFKTFGAFGAVRLQVRKASQACPPIKAPSNVSPPP